MSKIYLMKILHSISKSNHTSVNEYKIIDNLILNEHFFEYRNINTNIKEKAENLELIEITDIDNTEVDGSCIFL